MGAKDTQRILLLEAVELTARLTFKLSCPSTLCPTVRSNTTSPARIMTISRIRAVWDSESSRS